MNADGIFLYNSWYVAASNHELIDGKKLARTILERPIVLYRGASGKVVALDDRCCHRAAPFRWAASKATTSAACITA